MWLGFRLHRQTSRVMPCTNGPSTPRAGGTRFMNLDTRRNSGERGVALIVALISILVLGTLAATVIVTSQAQQWTSLNYRQATQARYAAEAGMQRTMDWLSNPT